MRTLIVEDDVHTIELLRFLVEKLGFETAVADNVVDALAALERLADIELVILDILLPSQSGVELLKYLNVEHPAIKVLIVSAHVGVLDKQDPLVQMTPKLAKPFRQEQFREAIYRLGFEPPAPDLAHI